MIRRREDDQWVLIRQDDHARLSGEIARHVGGGGFERVEERVVRAVQMHDAGWPLHDDEPTLNGRGEPIDVFESTRQIALKVWTASSDRAEAVDPYAGLLVSLHGLALSVFAMSRVTGSDLAAMQDRFALNQFQHAEVERQERLRGVLGLRTDLPLTYGVAKVGMDAREDRVVADFRLLRAMDLVSLAMCCTEPPSDVTQEVYPSVGDGPVKLKLARKGAAVVVVDPWPFDRERMEFEVPCKRMAARTFATAEEVREAYRKTAEGTVSLAIARA